MTRGELSVRSFRGALARAREFEFSKTHTDYAGTREQIIILKNETEEKIRKSVQTMHVRRKRGKCVHAGMSTIGRAGVGSGSNAGTSRRSQCERSKKATE